MRLAAGSESLFKSESKTWIFEEERCGLWAKAAAESFSLANTLRQRYARICTGEKVEHSSTRNTQNKKVVLGGMDVVGARTSLIMAGGKLTLIGRLFTSQRLARIGKLGRCSNEKCLTQGCVVRSNRNLFPETLSQEQFKLRLGELVSAG